MSNNQYSEKTIKVSINDLDFAPGPYCMSFITDLSKLERSIGQIGLIHPPHVVKNLKGELDIVTGYRRLQVLRQQGKKSVFCRDLSGRNMSELDLFLFNFYENFALRTFNAIEKGMILKRLSHYLDQEDILGHYLPQLDLQPHEGVMETYISLENLEAGHKKAIVKGSISMKSVIMISNMKSNDKSSIFNVILKLNLNNNQQLRFIEYVQDLAVMKEVAVAHIIFEAGIQNILNQKDNNIPQQSRRLLDYLKSKRQPRLTEAEKRLRRIINKVNLPPGSRIRSDYSFEDKDLVLEVLFEDGVDLLNKLRFISNSKYLGSLNLSHLLDC